MFRFFLNKFLLFDNNRFKITVIRQWNKYLLISDTTIPDI